MANGHRLFFPPVGVETRDPPESFGLKSTKPSTASQKIKSMLDVGDEPTAQEKEESGTSSNPKELEKELPAPPTEEPSPKKQKVDDDEDWVEIDKNSIPHASVEDVPDEEEKPKV